MDLVNLIISLLSGAAGGNVAGKAAPSVDLGTLGNTVAGLIGGSAGGWILQALNLIGSVAAASGATEAAHGLDLGGILANIGGSGIGGAILTAIVGLIKNSTKA